MCFVLVICMSSSVLASMRPVDSQEISFSAGTDTMTVGEGERGETYPVGRIDISLADPSSVADALANENIAQEIKDYISARYAKALESRDTNVVLTLFSQELLPQTRGMAEPVYRTVNGIQMRTDRLEEYGLQVEDKIVIGSGMRTTLSNLSNITISTLGMSDIENIALTAGGVSLLSALIQAGMDSYITGSREDFTRLTITYNNMTQWTYGYTGSEWQLGLVSQQAEVTSTNAFVYMYNDGNVKTKNIPNSFGTGEKLFRSPNYGSPWTVAYQNLNMPITEWLRTTICGKVLYF